MLHELHTPPLFLGYPGAPGADIGAVADLLLRVSVLADEVPELADMTLNTVIVRVGGVIAVDVTARLAPVGVGRALRHDPLLRRVR